MKNSQKPPPEEKRQDLQGIRGIAIISVLGFHFLPNLVPNGYVGVDQFFVLSGFLMCMLLQKSYEKQSQTLFDWITNFYIRRLKRILPLYFLVIFLALLLIYTVFPFTAIDSNVTSGKNALVFMSNRVGQDGDDYFSMLSVAIDVFTHTWSLSVEVQFYLLVPFLYLLGRLSGKLSDRLEIVFYLVIASISFAYSTFGLKRMEAFHSVLARVWQFSIGILAYLITETMSHHPNSPEDYSLLPESISDIDPDPEVPENPKSSSINPISIFKLLLTLIVIFTVFYPEELPSPKLRPFVTVLTGILMVFPSKSLLESRFLTWSGDISYSLYLIHWPIYSFWKLEYGMVDKWNWQLGAAFGASVLLAILSYEFFEKWYLKQPNSTIFTLSLLILITNLGLLYQSNIIEWITPPEVSNRLDGLREGEVVSYHEAEKLYRVWSRKDQDMLTAPSCEYEDGHGPIGYCRHKGLDGKNGTYKLMIIGNCYGMNHARIVYDECGSKAKSLVQHTYPGCNPLFHSHPSLERCSDSLEVFEQKVKEAAPDYLFIFARFTDKPDIHSNLDTDPIYLTMKSQIKKYEKYVTKKIFMMNQIARFNRKLGPKIAEAVLKKKNLVLLDKHLVEHYPERARLRYEKLASECPSKCELFDYKPYFFNETTHTWRFYDEANAGLSYMTHGLHLTPHGLELIRPVIRNLCSKL